MDSDRRAVEDSRHTATRLQTRANRKYPQFSDSDSAGASEAVRRHSEGGGAGLNKSSVTNLKAAQGPRRHMPKNGLQVSAVLYGAKLKALSDCDDHTVTVTARMMAL